LKIGSGAVNGVRLLKDTIKTIRQLNDELRTGPLWAGNIFVTAGVSGLGNPTVDGILEAVRKYDDFTKDNDPHGEHDFGVFDFDEHRIFWKIDYYDLSLKHGSNDPSDPTITKRILTVMLAEEY
jgi:hypothetical protein